MCVTSRALIVDPQPEEITAETRLLAGAGCELTVVSTFEEAKRQLAVTEDLSLLITAVQLKEFNGLHLALRARALFPRARIIVTTSSIDEVLKRQAFSLGAACVVKPLDASKLTDLLAALFECEPPTPVGTRRWARRTVPAEAAALIGTSTARLVDVSYGGVCLELPTELAGRLPPTLDVSLPRSGLAFRLHPIWARSSATPDVCLCGGELLETNRPSTERWRQFVDSSE